ncbi:hypothetical protein F511_15473 [Dorcoceras hygrometricum]|uniref:Uncharacterized protein n=1 Tax=Dorcoceras hygrometricum TaxID=472368 RepID=A0A2Z7B574_9LAMI|nr:hypothetical protein F511_15473 [Dorcoceras hygrometricum]
MAGRGRGIRSNIEGDSESEGVNPVLNSMAQLLERLVDQTNQGNGQSSGRIVSREYPQERFRRQRPQEFTGSTDPIIAESWIKSMEVIFELLGNNGAGSGYRLPGRSGKQNCPGDDQYNSKHIHRVFSLITLLETRAWLQPELQERRIFTVGGGRSVNQVHDRKRSPSDQPALED